MAYQTGSVASPSALITIIDTFATGNGFTSSGGATPIISDSAGASNTKLTAVAGAEKIKLEGANNAAFTVGVNARQAYLYAPLANWPVTYRLFYVAAPKTILCVIEYGQFISWLMFGALIKSSTLYVGGNFFCAQMAHHQGLFFGCNSTLGGGTVGASGYSSALPFWEDDFSGGALVGVNSYLHAEIDGVVWGGQETSGAVKIKCNRLVYPLIVRQPNLWNSHTILLPCRLVKDMSASLFADLGQLNGLRLMRTDNYNNGDIITLGPDRWMVFSAWKKDVINRNGIPGTTTGSTGTFGFAIFYDGP